MEPQDEHVSVINPVQISASGQCLKRIFVPNQIVTVDGITGVNGQLVLQLAVLDFNSEHEPVKVDLLVAVFVLAHQKIKKNAT